MSCKPCHADNSTAERLGFLRLGPLAYLLAGWGRTLKSVPPGRPDDRMNKRRPASVAWIANTLGCETRSPILTQHVTEHSFAVVRLDSQTLVRFIIYSFCAAQDIIFEWATLFNTFRALLPSPSASSCFFLCRFVPCPSDCSKYEHHLQNDILRNSEKERPGYCAASADCAGQRDRHQTKTTTTRLRNENGKWIRCITYISRISHSDLPFLHGPE